MRLTQFLSLFFTLFVGFLSASDNDRPDVTDRAEERRSHKSGTAPSIREVTLYAQQDTALLQVMPDLNQGGDSGLVLGSGGASRLLLRFDADQVLAATNGATLLSARLELFAADNDGNWVQGQLVDLHRLSMPWSEANATWNCAVGMGDECTAWQGGTFGPAAAS